MNLEEYKQIALQRLNGTIASSNKERMYYTCMGLIEESGEIVAELRKPLFKGNFHEKKLSVEHIKSELGDLMWYIALICKDNDINMQMLELDDERMSQMPIREKLIQSGINLGKISGEIVEIYQQVYNKERDNKDLIEKINEQCLNVIELGNQLNITIDEMLEANLKKISSRYKEDGESTR